MAELTRRQFLKVSGASLAGSSLALIGFSPTAALAEVREFKLARATETRNTCPYCSVSCGLLMYSLGDNAKNAKASIFHIEGDPDHPVNRGTLCPKGAGLIERNGAPELSAKLLQPVVIESAKLLDRDFGMADLRETGAAETPENVADAPDPEADRDQAEHDAHDEPAEPIGRGGANTSKHDKPFRVG